jgi:hypothetical protein
MLLKSADNKEFLFCSLKNIKNIKKLALIFVCAS